MKIWIDNENLLNGEFRLGLYTGKVIFTIGKYKVCKTYVTDNKKLIEKVF